MHHFIWYHKHSGLIGHHHCCHQCLFECGFDETFAPVIRMENLRLLLAIATAFDYEIHQMDVDTAFLNAKLSEEVFLDHPEGFIDKEHPSNVCKLLRSLYGLKQAPYKWNRTIDQHLHASGYQPTVADPSIYVKHSGQDVVFIAI